MSTSSHVPQSRRYTRRQKSVASLPRRAVPYAAEMLERRTLLFAELNLSPELFYDAEAKRAQADFIARLAAHRLTEAEMHEQGIASIDWQGQPVYARRDEWLVRLTIADGSDAQEVLDGLILWMAAPAPTYATERTETTRPTQSVPSLTHARTSKLQGTGHDSPSAKRSAEDSAVSRP